MGYFQGGSSFLGMGYVHEIFFLCLPHRFAPLMRIHKSNVFSCFIYPTWWLIPLSKWVITPVISGISRVSPLITEVLTHLLSGMSHQVLDHQYPTISHYYECLPHGICLWDRPGVALIGSFQPLMTPAFDDTG